MTIAQKSVPSRYIRRIYVESLFGEFDHDLRFGETIPESPNLMILYGENGTGKTTLLWLLYHLLNRGPREGHRTYLAKKQFKRISVTFSDGVEISAERDESRTGPFIMEVISGRDERVSFAYNIDPEGRNLTAPDRKASDLTFLANLPEFNFGFLPHDRSTRSSAESRRWRRFSQRRLPVDEDESPISNSIGKAIGTARQQAIRSSNQGQLTVNGIYTALIQRMAHVQLTPPEGGVEEGRFNLLRRLQDQAKLTQDYSEFGLISELQVEGLLGALRTMPASRFYIVDQVLEPFLSGNEARFEALKALYIALTTTVESVNSLYLNKRITIHLEKGLHIYTMRGQPLLPTQLSSGEQELLILFCEVIGALRPNTLLFIDEPELSLNVSWQRRLLDALLKCASGSNVQFVIATHSIELLTRYRPNVTRLSNKPSGTAEISDSEHQPTE